MVGAGLLRQSLLTKGIELRKREQKGGHHEGCTALEEKTESWAIHVPSQSRFPFRERVSQSKPARAGFVAAYLGELLSRSIRGAFRNCFSAGGVYHRVGCG
jgi:hypothetical protein